MLNQADNSLSMGDYTMRLLTTDKVAFEKMHYRVSQQKFIFQNFENCFSVFLLLHQNGGMFVCVMMHLCVCTTFVCLYACMYAGCLCKYVMVSFYVITFCVYDFVRFYISGFVCVYLGMWVRFMPLVSICAFMYNCVGMFMCLSVFVHFCLLCCGSNYFDQIFAASKFTFHGFCFELWTEADE